LQTVKPGTTIRTWHAHYTTAIQCINPPYLPADLHTYSPINDVLHADNTIVFVVAQVHVPHTGNVLLDVLHIVPHPGDPSQDSYDDTVPNFQFPMVYGLGIVLTPHKTLPNSSTAFSVALTKYIHDMNQQSNVCMLMSFKYCVANQLTAIFISTRKREKKNLSGATSLVSFGRRLGTLIRHPRVVYSE
jgi:hypothetical protein